MSAVRPREANPTWGRMAAVLTSVWLVACTDLNPEFAPIADDHEDSSSGEDDGESPVPETSHEESGTGGRAADPHADADADSPGNDSMGDDPTPETETSTTADDDSAANDGVGDLGSSAEAGEGEDPPDLDPIEPSLLELPAVSDAWLREMHADERYGDDVEVRVGAGSEMPRGNRALLRFDLAQLRSCDIREAWLELWAFDAGTDDWPDLPTQIGVHAVTSAWDETRSTWRERDDGIAWSEPGADFGRDALDIRGVSGGDVGAVRWDVRELVEGWCRQEIDNRGLVLFESGDRERVQTRRSFVARESPEVDRRPRLVVRID